MSFSDILINSKDKLLHNENTKNLKSILKKANSEDIHDKKSMESESF